MESVKKDEDYTYSEFNFNIPVKKIHNLTISFNQNDIIKIELKSDTSYFLQSNFIQFTF